MTGPNWFYNQAPTGVTYSEVNLKVRWALSPRGVRHRVVSAEAAWLDGEVRFAGRWLCGDGCTGITLLADGTDEGRVCQRCQLREDWPGGPVVYRIWNTAELLYIGSTGDLGKRLYQHTNSADWWTDGLRIEATPFPSLNVARSVEAKAIAVEQPKHNRIHHPGWKRRHRTTVTCS